MKPLITQLNKAFDHRVRLGLMSVLMVEDWVDFTTFRERLDLTDGNLATHLTALERENYIEVRKQFAGKKPQTSYRASVAGRKAFEEHISALEALLKQIQDES